ncbi:bifunctional hydroxymethylpyrimidine kinase/phosphomethylpyrimidine kinase [Burkholderia cenocepacia]|nr:bifunctional hydroxymethylpyrimidine kinase/phosphomethylpyrimidine kinase [Burkholderia cenocepacia]
MTYLPVALTIAGTDPSGGAGIMADLKSFQARDVYGMAVVTSLVAQNTRGVQLIEHVSPQMLKAQLESIFSDIPPQAVKTKKRMKSIGSVEVPQEAFLSVLSMDEE